MKKSNGDMKNLKEISTVVNTVEAKADFNLVQIPVNQIINNPKNNFGMRDIEKLAESMKEHGQVHNAVVRKIEVEGDELPYRLISGERRWRASQLLGWTSLTCKVVECTDIEEEQLIIISNMETREINEVEKAENVQRLIELTNIKRKNGEDLGGKKTRVIVAEQLNVSPATVQKYIGMKKLIPEFKDMLAKNEIGIDESTQYSQMPEEVQIMVFNSLTNGLKHNAKIAKELKDKLKLSEKTYAEKIEEMKKEIENKDNEVKKTNIEANKKVDETTKKLEQLKDTYKESEVKFKSADEEIKKYKEQLVKKEEEIKGVGDTLRKKIEEELKNKPAENDGENNPKVIELRKQIKNEEEKAEKEKAEMLVNFESNNKKLKELEIEKNKFKSLLDKKEVEKKKKLISEANITYNIELALIAKQTKALFVTLVKKMSTIKDKEGFEINAETKEIIAEISKFESQM
ncbi:ParB/RepB/Spo0J family partition protein [Clostridium estertheticum]|uniref:ParB/RepB/Spo0J family partition protein n=1 Tax=Clostridium estertheticum TaxID=238834 RepID=UPI001C7DC9B4|nr:ParB N-terminal domain-containing protein [Clostridium estertheticum]MBX4267169.1 ParB/RepB/Spo0J family partition protein [Clostridium estertheticum]WLC91292.1 ParB/RepB/Spo0J family partition protein [Clostridium estertheticum]